ncbi:peptidase inhibitor family I36 protein [Micromonospora sp. NBRC 101691]|uniref:peptidase inhibitor family I36 protein n=1 Tax=Micromonospora sp. NBRC 101691 TaxID=3032198 RepID=UPI0024A1A7CA|nr:peptidase inhibitor family I36 protein [Micromonospora sp. NBRC 101691]GLY25692.1 hypothetical protein Misp04_54230 [Micromonospora sp. NBRC 101691]
MSGNVAGSGLDWLRRIAAAGAAVTLATVGVVTVHSSPAQAHLQDCPDNYVCIWGDANYQGRYLFVPHVAVMSNIGSFMNDLASSYWNRTPTGMCFYRHTNFTGHDSLYVHPGQSIPRDQWSTNDTISSFRPAATNDDCV